HQMNDMTDEFVGRLSLGTIAVFYYSGHAVQVSGINYLIPIDIRANKESDLVHDGLDLQSLIARMGAADDGFNLAIIDACRDNPFRVGTRSLGGRQRASRTE